MNYISGKHTPAAAVLVFLVSVCRMITLLTDFKFQVFDCAFHIFIPPGGVSPSW